MTFENGHDIWIPGEPLSYEPYEQEHLLEDWGTIYASQDERPVISIRNGLLGVVHAPEEPPSKVASVDLCEVLRETHFACVQAMGKERAHIGSNVWIYTTLGFERNVSTEIVKAVMNADLVEPVEQINEIKELILQWKQEGIYVVANTSTLPNCEQATIRNLLSRELPGCFDGIVFPRNFHGEGNVTKGDALKAVVSTISNSLLEKTVHIDDAPYHLNSVSLRLGEIAAETALFMPAYIPGELAALEDPIENLCSSVIAVPSPLEAFEKATEFLLRD